jgi:hypothetical protein
MALSSLLGLVLVPVTSAQATSTQQARVVTSVDRSTVKTARVVWKKIPGAKRKAPYGREYQFEIERSPASSFMRVNTLNLRVKVRQIGGRVVVRTFPYAYGDEDFVVWEVHLGKAMPLKAWVRASWTGRHPETRADRFS